MRAHHRFALLALASANLALAQNSNPTMPNTPAPPPVSAADQADAARRNTDAADGSGSAAYSDGRVSREEATPDGVLSEIFAKADRNSDGFVDTLEFRRYEKARARAQESLPPQ